MFSFPHRNPHFLYGFIFFVIAVVSLAVIVILVSLADNTTQTVAITNAAPTVDNVTISATSYGGSAADLTLTENTTITAYVFGAASDTNGCDEIDQTSQFTLKFFRTDQTDACSADNNNCYTASAATTVDQCTPGGSDTSSRYQFAVSVQYWADSTDAGGPNAATTWTAKVIATDDGASTGNATTTTEMNSLIALNVTAAIDYGTVALNAVSNEQTATITNTGNRNMDANVKGDANMTCTTVGAIDIGQVKYSLSQGFTYASQGTAMTLVDANTTNSTAQRTNEGVASTTPLYFKLGVPASGVAGTCTNTLTFTAIADV